MHWVELLLSILDMPIALMQAWLQRRREKRRKRRTERGASSSRTERGVREAERSRTGLEPGSSLARGPMRVEEIMEIAIAEGAAGDLLPWSLADMLWESQLGRTRSGDGYVAMLFDELLLPAGEATSAVLIVTDAAAPESTAAPTPFAGGRRHFAVGDAAVKHMASTVSVAIRTMVPPNEVRATGKRALLVTLIDRTVRLEAPPDLERDRAGYLAWALDWEREVEVLGWFVVERESEQSRAPAVRSR